MSSQSINKKAVKNWTSFQNQLDLLESRGLIIDDKDYALRYLKNIGYYHLSAYFYPFRQVDTDGVTRLDNFVVDSHFYHVKELFLFDKKLRHLTLDALERIEVAMRTHVVYSLGRYHPLAHLDAQYFDPTFDHAKWLEKYENSLKKNKKMPCIQHYHKQYEDIPIWVGAEVWDFGLLSTLYQGMKQEDKNAIAKIYCINSGKQLQSYLHAFNVIRNICAHYSRLWNKDIAIKASPKHLDSQLQALPNSKVFFYFCLIKKMLNVICPHSDWGNRLLALLREEFPATPTGVITLRQMGVPDDQPRWYDWDLWQKNSP